MGNRLVLLGSVRLTGPAQPCLRRALQQRRLALLAVLASAPGESISRDRLLGLLWPERDERAARHLLADSLYVLRQALGDEAIVSSGEHLHLSADIVSADVVEFRHALADERWADALRLYRGDFLDGFFLRNAAEFDQWAMAERVRLRALATRAASAWTTVLEATGRISDAVAAAERALELSPADESACRDLVRLLIASGNCAQAEAAGRRFVERLALDLGLSPSAETMRVVREAAAPAKTDTIIVVPGRDSRHRRGRTTDSVTAGIITQGRYHWHRRTRASIERAIAYFTRAADRDARAVDAECGLADSWIVMGGRAYMPVEDAIEHAAASAERALALDDTVSAVHTSIGGLNILRRRWDDAASALRRAIQIDPHNADAHHWLSLVLTTGFGARSDAHAEQAIAARLNPVAPMQVCALGWYRYLHGDYDSARLEMEPAVDLNADFEEGHAGLARVAARLGDQATVRRTIADGLARRADLQGDLLAEYASALAVLGEVRGARRLAAEAATHRAMPLNLALAWASVGDAERAFECLERESYLVYWAPHAVWWDPRLDVIRDDARFDRIRQKVARVWSPEW